MKVQIIYASRTGCTRRLAEAIYEGIPGKEKSIHDLAEGIPELTGDIVLLGYWGIAGGPDQETRAFLSSVSGKAVGIFCPALGAPSCPLPYGGDGSGRPLWGGGSCRRPGGEAPHRPVLPHGGRGR